MPCIVCVAYFVSSLVVVSSLAWGPQSKLTFTMMRQGAASGVQLVQLYGFWYSHNEATGIFEKVPRMPSDLPQQLGKALHAVSAIDKGRQAAEALSVLSSSIVFVQL